MNRQKDVYSEKFTSTKYNSVLAHAPRFSRAYLFSFFITIMVAIHDVICLNICLEVILEPATRHLVFNVVLNAAVHFVFTCFFSIVCNLFCFFFLVFFKVSRLYRFLLFVSVFLFFSNVFVCYLASYFLFLNFTLKRSRSSI